MTIAWTTDRTDVDLHVLDPTGEECDYRHRDTRMGGHLTSDVTTGYGPEMFVLRRAAPGRYRILVVSFATDRLRTSTRTRVIVTIREDWSRANERVATLTVAPPESGRALLVATIDR